MYVDVSAGELYDAMAAAIENASIVVICLTEKYKESANCRLGNQFFILYVYIILLANLKQPKCLFVFFSVRV